MFCQRADWFLLVFPSHVCTCRAETAMVTCSPVNLSLLASLVKSRVARYGGIACCTLAKNCHLLRRFSSQLLPSSVNGGSFTNAGSRWLLKRRNKWQFSFQSLLAVEVAFIILYICEALLTLLNPLDPSVACGFS